ncbi:hypothetical protein COHA_001551 [Chlorella ohadii]|uniref:Uncharacterized protein n=1 Tax=Chlorella ohadii TaxID=2649997 RepID=A0AAD5DWF8_9CHLO|nr:hypothetical protein COHA_001551 [Chlorella ohadii]
MSRERWQQLDRGGGGGFNFSEWGDNFKRSMTGLFQTVATILLFAAALGALALWKPLLSLLGRLVRSVLRLDGNPRAQLAKQSAAPQADLSKQERLGNVEEAVISKYAAADDDEEEGGENEE